MGDFNAKIGKHQNNERVVGNYGYGERNERGDTLAELLRTSSSTRRQFVLPEESITKMDMAKPERRYTQRDRLHTMPLDAPHSQCFSSESIQYRQ